MNTKTVSARDFLSDQLRAAKIIVHTIEEMLSMVEVKEQKTQTTVTTGPTLKRAYRKKRKYTKRGTTETQAQTN